MNQIKKDEPNHIKGNNKKPQTKHKCQRFQNLLQIGTHKFNTNSQESHQFNQYILEQISLDIGIIIIQNKSLELFLRNGESSINECSIQKDQFYDILNQYDSQELLQVYSQIDEAFIKELIVIWQNLNNEEILASYWIKQSIECCQPQFYPLVLRNAYLVYVKNNGLDMSFKEFIMTIEAYNLVLEFIYRAQLILRI